MPSRQGYMTQVRLEALTAQATDFLLEMDEESEIEAAATELVGA